MVKARENLKDLSNNKYKLDLGMFNSSRSERFMIHIVNQVMSVNDTEYVATFFKDITFGVLYEQIKAQESFKNVITRTIQSKLW